MDVGGRELGAASHVDAGWCFTVTEVEAVSFVTGETVSLCSAFARGLCVSGGVAFFWVAAGMTYWLTGSGGGVGLTDSLAGGGVGEVEVDEVVIEIADVSGEDGGAGLLDALLWPGAGLAEALLSDPSSESNKRERLR